MEELGSWNWVNGKQTLVQFVEFVNAVSTLLAAGAREHVSGKGLVNQ